MTPFPVIEFTEVIGATCCLNKEVIGTIYEAATGAIIVGNIQPFCFLISCFTGSLGVLTKVKNKLK